MAMIWKKLRKKRTILSLCLIVVSLVLLLNFRYTPLHIELAKKQFEQHNIPILIYSSYRHEYLAKSVDALRKLSNDIKPSTTCTFVLHRTNGTTISDIAETKKIIDGVTFCRVREWKYEDKLSASSLTYKKLWLKTMKRFFNEDEVTYDGDVLILEEDAVLSNDAIKVLWFCRRMKNELGLEIRQVVLASHAGENLLNPHPNTFVVRRTNYIQPMAYAFNRTLWNIFMQFEKEILSHELDDFTDAASDILSEHFKQNGMFYHIATPTLSRAWHIGKKGIGLFGGKGVERYILPPPSWAVEVDLDKAVINDGIRDNFGAQCNPDHMENILYFGQVSCKQQFTLYLHVYRYRLVNCIKMPYSSDPCMDFDPATNKIEAPD